jgi:hypothetical protein
MTNTPNQASEQKPASPAPASNPQQNQGTPSQQPSNDKPSQPQQK